MFVFHPGTAIGPNDLLCRGSSRDTRGGYRLGEGSRGHHYKQSMINDNKCLDITQAQQLVQMICYPGGVPEMPEEDEDDEDQEPVQKQIITRILKVN